MNVAATANLVGITGIARRLGQAGVAATDEGPPTAPAGSLPAATTDGEPMAAIGQPGGTGREPGAAGGEPGGAGGEPGAAGSPSWATGSAHGGVGRQRDCALG